MPLSILVCTEKKRHREEKNLRSRIHTPIHFDRIRAVAAVLKLSSKNDEAERSWTSTHEHIDAYIGERAQPLKIMYNDFDTVVTVAAATATAMSLCARALCTNSFH